MIAERSQFAEARRASSVFAILVDHSSSRLLLLRKRKGGGHWTLPGGKAKRGEPLKEVLIRETRWQTGLTVEPASLLARLTHSGTHKTSFYYLCRILSKSTRKRSPFDKITADRWFARQSLPLPRSPALRQYLAWYTANSGGQPSMLHVNQRDPKASKTNEGQTQSPSH